MQNLQEFKNLLEYYDNIKHLEYDCISLKDYIENFTKKYSSYMVGGKYVPPLQDLTHHFKTPEDIFGDYGKRLFEDILTEIIQENTRHGERGATEHSKKFLIYDRVYEVEISGVEWNRYDKQYYYIDNYKSPIIEIKLLN